MLENLIILTSDIHTTITTYWVNHPTFTSIVGTFIALRILWIIFKAAKQLIKVLFDQS
jgi:divalent metal cation (Fe/Co/Zn/Cd) transporter